jgi:hypothetical protein
MMACRSWSTARSTLLTMSIVHDMISRFALRLTVCYTQLVLLGSLKVMLFIAVLPIWKHIVTCYLRSQPIQRFVAGQQLRRHATVLETLLGSSYRVTMEVQLEVVFSVWSAPRLYYSIDSWVIVQLWLSRRLVKSAEDQDSGAQVRSEQLRITSTESTTVTEDSRLCAIRCEGVC